MKNVTISLPDHVLVELRRKACSSGKSLNSWLRDLLTKEVESSDWFEEYRRVIDSMPAVTAEKGWKWNREAFYEEIEQERGKDLR